MDIYDSAEAIQGDDYIVKFKIKNGPLMRAIRLRGYKTLTAFREANGITGSSLNKLLALTTTPKKPNGDWKDTVLKIASALKMPPESLFPEQHLEVALKKSSGEFSMSSQDIATLIAPDTASVEDRELLFQKLEKSFENLSPREERILRMRFGFNGEHQTLEQIAKQFNVNRERIRILEARALRKLRGDRELRRLNNHYDD